MSLIKRLNESANAKAEMKRIADHWTDVTKNTKMTDKQLMDVIGNDLEQLEYSPTQVDNMTTNIFNMIRPAK